MQKGLKNLLLAGLAIGFIAVSAFAGITLRNNSLNQIEKASEVLSEQVFKLQVTLIDSELKETSLSMNANINETLFSVLQKYDINNDNFEMEYSEYDGLGAFITKFNDISMDSSSQFWELFINGKSSLTGPSMYKIQEGDQIAFKITNFN